MGQRNSIIRVCPLDHSRMMIRPFEFVVGIIGLLVYDDMDGCLCDMLEKRVFLLFHKSFQKTWIGLIFRPSIQKAQKKRKSLTFLDNHLCDRVISGDAFGDR